MNSDPNFAQKRGASPIIRCKSIVSRLLRAVAWGTALAITLFAGHWVLAQSTPPVLTIAPTGTNQLLITVTNPVSSVSYELWSTPVLGNTTDYPWTVAALGATNQTAFTVAIGPYPAEFYRVILDTNTIPIWELADPNNPSAGILAVFIDSPMNGAVLQ